MSATRCLLVSHFHWDREWYRTFEAYRGRLVDAVDRVLDIAADDPGYRFVLDGQAILLEDYLAVRPDRRVALADGLATGRLAAGPWYVQPDVLLPSGESLVRNLLIGRAVVRALGPVARTGYVPDSFGHPAQMPQILAGFGIDRFVYWRGNGDEIDHLGARWRWVAPDGSAVVAVLLPDGYFDAACLPDDPDAAARGLVGAVRRRREVHGDPVLLMNGFDHMLPDAHTAAVAARLGMMLDEPVARVLLDEAVATLPAPAADFSGELLGGRLANLLPGVWSTRMAIKLANRACETALEGWAEPWCALGRALGLPDERASLGAAWRTLVQNHAHDSISIARVLDRLAGTGPERRTPWKLGQDVAVFNPSPHARSDVVRVALDPYPGMRIPLGLPEFPPLGLAASQPPGFAIDGRPVRVVPTTDPARTRWLPGQTPFDVEFVAADVPGFGMRRVRLEPCEPHPDVVDDGSEIVADGVRAAVAADGTLAVELAGRSYAGLLAVEDVGDRGDSYDFDPVPGDGLTARVTWSRRRHPSGIASLEVRRLLRVPSSLADDRTTRGRESIGLPLVYEARVAPGVPRVDLRVRVENTARDHRLRLLFPTGRPIDRAFAATTFGVAERATAPRDGSRWLHPAPDTFPHQGWVSANDLTVAAPGLPEAEVRPDGTIALTLVRAVGWIARFDLTTRPVPAGPAMPIAGAQVPEAIEAQLSLLAGADPVAARDAELGLRGAVAGDRVVLSGGRSLLTMEPAMLLLSALKPAEDGEGLIVRVLEVAGAPTTAVLRFGFRVRGAEAVRLDETPIEDGVAREGDTIRLDLPARALRSVRVLPA
jgi:mannosylglycerate hydrolase